jgi:putative oxidoreductase
MDFNLTTALVTVGQLFIGALYVYGGLNHFGPAADKIVPVLAARGVPMPRQSLYAASVFQAACGACLMLGIAVVPAAIGLVVFTLAASLVMVNFWDLPPGETRDLLQGVFASNVAIIGGLLVVIAQAL